MLNASSDCRFDDFTNNSIKRDDQFHILKPQTFLEPNNKRNHNNCHQKHDPWSSEINVDYDKIYPILKRDNET